jgi:pilus assembly protein CpaD
MTVSFPRGISALAPWSRRGLKRRRTIGLVIGLGLGVCGCATRTPISLGEEPRSESAKGIEVVEATHRLTLTFAGEDLAPRPPRPREEDLDALLSSGDVGEGDRVRIERGVGVLADARARAVAATLRRGGVKVEILEMAGTPELELHVLISRSEATVMGCPDWSDVTGDGPLNALPRDFGCAVAGDLAAMISDPHDLITGRRLAPQVGDAALYAMRRYRYGDPSSSSAAAPVNIIGPTTSNATAPPPPQTAATPPPAAAVGPANAGSAAAGPAAPVAVPRGASHASPS